MHVIVINGVSRSGNLWFINPNAVALNWGRLLIRSQPLLVHTGTPSPLYQSYMSLDRCLGLAQNRQETELVYPKSDPKARGVERRGPFWQHRDDYHPPT